MNAATSAGAADVATRPPVARRKASRRRWEKEPMQTRSWLPVRSTSSASGRTADADLMSMLNRTSGNASSSSAIVGTACSPAMRARRISSAVSRESSPWLSVTRSSTASWKASSTPSLVACTSVSR